MTYDESTLGSPFEADAEDEPQPCALSECDCHLFADEAPSPSNGEDGK